MLRPPSARGPSRYRRRSCPRPSAEPAQSNRRRSRWIAARSHLTAHTPPPQHRRGDRPNALTRSPSAPPAGATAPPSRFGREPSIGPRDGNSSCQVAHLSLLFCIFLAGFRRGLTWHIHAELGNAGGG